MWAFNNLVVFLYPNPKILRPQNEKDCNGTGRCAVTDDGKDC